MSIWQTLDIPPTRDESEIRRAYARQLKKHRPDNDPIGYQRLREAFDTAKQQVRVSDSAIPESGKPGDDAWPTAAAVFSPNIPGHPTETLPDVVSLYTEQEINALAYKLVNTEIMGTVLLNQLSSRVLSQGSLAQQQLFHQHLAAALAEQSGLSEPLLDRIAGQLGWRMDDYDYSHIIPASVQQALYHQLRQTEIKHVWEQMSHGATKGTFRDKLAIRLLRSDRQRVPFWVRLVPGMVQILAHQYQYLMQYYPELVTRLNPVMRQFLQQARLGVSLGGILLLIFWSAVFYAAVPLSGGMTAVSVTTMAIILFYLFFSDMIQMSVHSRPILFSAFLGIEFLFSLIVIQWFFGGLFFAAITSVPTPGLAPALLVAMIFILVSVIVVRAAWPQKKVPPIRVPGMIMSRIFASPWKLVEWMNYSWFSAVWLLLYYVICTAVIVELIKRFN